MERICLLYCSVTRLCGVGANRFVSGFARRAAGHGRFQKFEPMNVIVSLHYLPELHFLLPDLFLGPLALGDVDDETPRQAWENPAAPCTAVAEPPGDYSRDGDPGSLELKKENSS